LQSVSNKTLKEEDIRGLLDSYNLSPHSFRETYLKRI
jgi:hypothetical protein